MKRRHWALVVAVPPMLALMICAGLALVGARHTETETVVATAAEPPSEPPAPALPPDPFEGLCTTACDVRPDRPPPPLRPPPQCVGDRCRTSVELRFRSNRFRVELDGIVHFEPTTIERWSGPGTVQIYNSIGQTFRCNLDFHPGGEVIDVSDAEGIVQARTKDGHTECGLVRHYWRIHTYIIDEEVMPADVLDALLEAAADALPPDRFASDRDVTTWLFQHGVLSGRQTLLRDSPGATATDGGAVIALHMARSNDERESNTSFDWIDGGFIANTMKTSHRFRAPEDTGEWMCRSWTPDRQYAIRLTTAGAPQRFQLPGPPCDPVTPITNTTQLLPLDVWPDPVPRARRSDALPANLGDATWMLAAEPQPSALRAPTGSLAELGAWFAVTEADQLLRAKAVHDWVALNVIYDVAALDGPRPPQDAQTVFETGRGVCAGYANLMVALGTEAGLEVVYLRGHTRKLDSAGHAWNAVRVKERWYLLDATWDAGSLGDDGFVAQYGTRYLFTPPDVFRTTHHPADPSWQLMAAEGVDDFLDRPRLTGGLVVTRAPTIQGGPQVEIVDPERRPLTVALRDASGAVAGTCDQVGDTFRCPSVTTGHWTLDVEVQTEHGPRFAGLLEVRAGD